MTPIPKTGNPREAAYLALLASLREERFIPDTLEEWRKNCLPSTLDFHFATQIAFGAAQMASALDYIASQLATQGRLSLKLKERALMRLALYQYYFLERVPIYAIADETINLANKYCHSTFSKFLNAVLRKLAETKVSLPQGDTVDDLAIKYSYPHHFIESLINAYGLEKAKEIMQIGNQRAPIMARIRTNKVDKKVKLVCEKPFPVCVLEDSSVLPTITSSPDYYIQNATPATLIGHLCENYESAPLRILDLCASPGGKLIAIHDFFPQAVLYGNDISHDKLRRLSENCVKYGVEASLSYSKGEEYSNDKGFDIIILDVPCSNSGVLNKRPEARWRLISERLEAIKQMQLKLIRHAATLLNANGELWYMTCSILPQENEQLIQETCQQFNLKVRHQEIILPNSEGWDGGFAALLSCI